MEKNIFRQETSVRSSSELGHDYINAYTCLEFQDMLSSFRKLALINSDDIDVHSTASTWPPPPPTSTSSSTSTEGLSSTSHPIGNKVGGIDGINNNNQNQNSNQNQANHYDIEVHPLSIEYSKLYVISLIARSYIGLEKEYSQELRNHSAAQANLYKLSAKKSDVYYFPYLTHMNLWQQSDEVTSCVNILASQVTSRVEE